MGLNVELLRTSFEMLAPKAEQLADRFYQILFERNPEIMQLFSGTDMSVQRKMLIEALTGILGLLEESEGLKEKLFELGQAHSRYGVTEDHFYPVGQALIMALSEEAGPVWNESLEAVWTEAFEVIADGMMAGMKPSKMATR